MKSRRTFITLGLLVGSIMVVALAMFALTAPTATAGDGQIESEPPLIDDFEDGLPAGWFQYGDYGSGTWINHTPEITDTRPGGIPTTTVLAVSYNSAGWGAGTGHDLAPPQDWSDYDGFSFWFYGTNTGGTFRVILSDNRSDPGSDTSERFAYEFVDDTAGWRYISIPWASFFRDYAYQPPGAPDDGLTL
ncbi:MAG: carbohydrate binding domain-containing protein, partial [Anaerolineae bacterium]